MSGKIIEYTAPASTSSARVLRKEGYVAVEVRLVDHVMAVSADSSQTGRDADGAASDAPTAVVVVRVDFVGRTAVRAGPAVT